MFCSHCGKEVAAGAKFCANCGAAINSQPAPAAEPPKAPAPTAQREVPAVERVGSPSGNMTGSGGQPEKKKKGVPKKPLIIVAAVLVLIVGFGAVLSLFEGDSEPDSDSEGSNGLDWVEKIPIMSVDNELLSDETAEFFAEYWHQTSYPEIAGESTPDTSASPDKTFGMPVINDAQYYIWKGGVFVQENSETVYCLTYYPEPKSFSSMTGLNILSIEPLIAKNSENGSYLLMCKNNNAYEILVARATDPTSPYSTWQILAYIVASSEEYCGFLNGDVPVEVISIPGESGNSDLEATAPGTDYAQYTGTWASNGVGWIHGGQILDIAVSGDTMTATFEHIAPAPTSQLAEVSVTIPLSNISNGTATATFDNDGWGQTGTITLTFTESGIVCDMKDVLGGEPYSTWGILEETYLLVRDDGAHEKMIYDMDTYYEMFPEEDFRQAPATEPTATAPEPPAGSDNAPDDGTAGTVDPPALPEGAQYVSKLEEYVADPTSLDLTLGRESDYISLSLGRQRNMLDYPLDYIGTKAIFPWPLQVLSSGETQNGYRYYAVNEMDNSIAEEDKVDVVLIDVRENAAEDIKAIGDEFKSYLVFAGGVHTDEGWYIAFFVTADI